MTLICQVAMAQQIVHTTTGRVRFRVPRVQRDPAYGELLVQLLESLAIVERVRLNPQAATVVVQYQPHLLDEAVVYEQLNQCFEQARVAMPQPLPESAAPADAIALEDYEAQVEADARLETDWERLGLPLVALGGLTPQCALGIALRGCRGSGLGQCLALVSAGGTADESGASPQCGFAR
ncbi:MAG TPA: hypothetical protein IGP91_05025 [Thermosynechococcus sp. M46_R2017_013]|nr:hypothetical protein [Thermosynechococcus sp. M46_R2017_013]